MGFVVQTGGEEFVPTLEPVWEALDPVRADFLQSQCLFP